MRADNALDLGIKPREEIRVAEQYPVEEQYVVNFHYIQNYHKSVKELQKAEIIFHAVPYGEHRRTREKEHRDCNNYPANDMRAAKTLFFVGYHRQNILVRGREKALVLHEADPAVQNQKIPRHDHYRGNERHQHFKFLLQKMQPICCFNYTTTVDLSQE